MTITSISCTIAILCIPAAAQRANLPAQLQGITIQQRLGNHVPLDTQFLNEQGNLVPLRTYFKSRPVVLAMVYYTCPMLCGEILRGAVSGLRPLSLKAGRDFEFVAISINPNETPADAITHRDLYANLYSRDHDTSGWHFLVGTQSAIHAVADAVGFRYRYDPKNKMFTHASGIMILTPQGRMSRYFYGVNYQPNDLKLGLIEASNNTIGSAVDQILLYCYHYDPHSGKYTLVVLNLMRGAGVAVILALAIGLIVFWRRDIRSDRRVLREARHP